MQCPLLYRFRVVDRLPEPPSLAAARGTLVHAVLERLFDLPAERRDAGAAHALLPEQWARMVAEEPALTALVTGRSPDPDEAQGAAEPLDQDEPGPGDPGATTTNTPPGELAALFAEAEALIDRWFTLEDPSRLEPAERELYVEADVEGVTLRGYVDRLDVAPDGRLRVVDYKTGRAPSELFEGKALFQMKFYALVLWRTRGVVPTMLQLVYLRDGQILRYEPTEHDLHATERKIQALWVAIDRAARTGDWRPRTSRLCDWCHHQAVCPAFGGTPPPLPEDAQTRALDPRRSGLTSAEQTAQVLQSQPLEAVPAGDG
jgi:putative RecB family exonuclease